MRVRITGRVTCSNEKTQEKGDFLMKERIEKRLRDLRVEFESGQKMLADLEVKQSNLRNTLLRISGAIQVLEEALGQESQPAGNGAVQQGEADEQRSIAAS
jgi:predicted nuclease with TOPRIM domain